MFKFLLIIFLISYVLYKVGGFFFRMLFMNLTQQQSQRGNARQQQKRPADGNVSIDYVPEEKSKKRAGMKGGEYVDFEDVKD